jgi:hypothetical protein
MQQQTPIPLNYAANAGRAGRRRWGIAVIGCLASWISGCFAGAWIAGLYERAMYPPARDPVHFDVGGVFLLAWAAIGLLGSTFFLVRAVRGGRAAAA